MTHRLFVAWLTALTLLAAGTLPGQDPPELATLRASLADASRELRASEPAVVIGAIARIAALTDDADAADRLGVVTALASALQSKDAGVVTAAADVLAKVPNRRAGIAVLTDHLSKLVEAVRRTPEPRWPKPTPAELVLPRMPPLPPGRGKPTKEYQRQLREYERAEKDRERKLERDRARVKRELAAAEADYQRQQTATARLVDFAGCLSHVRQDAVVDLLVQALRLTLDREPGACAPIVGALAATGRRDAVDECVAILAKPDTVERWLKLQFARTFVGLDLTRRLEKGAGSMAPDPEAGSFLGQVREHLVAVGVRHGVAAPDPSTARDQLRRLMGIKGDDAGPDGTSNPWQEWSLRIAPKLPERLDADGSAGAPAKGKDLP